MSTNRSNRRGGEVRELQQDLASNQMTQKKAAVRKIIDAMTRGKDVSMLFTDMVKNMETSDLELKKLIYLYVINYAKSHPDMTILAINSFRKDSRDKVNPFLRAMAVRTMGCIRVKQITEYLLDSLKSALSDEDSYVRKTAAICVAKFYDVEPNLLEDQGFVRILGGLMNDGNAFVVSNALVALSAISEAKGTNLVKLTPHSVQKLLTALNECQEWGQIYILDALAKYTPLDAKETEIILERVSPRLSHANAGVVLSAVKVMMKYLDFISVPEIIRQYCRKLSSPLISLMNMENEIQYIALKNINLIIQKRPMILDKELKIFFCKFNDPIYLKNEKLEVLIRLANMDNVQQILPELRDYTNEIDVEFVKKSVKTIGRIAIKLEKAAEKCVHVLWECLKTKVQYVVQEAIIVIRDIFRKYPRKYEAILTEICDNLKQLEDPEAKSSMIWIIGEYVDTIENADQLLENFMEGFKEESSIVQLQIMTSCVKLFLVRPEDGQELIQNLLKLVTEESENPDLRDRGFIYWRLMATDSELAKRIVFADRPTISDLSYTLESVFLDKLIENIGELSSIYTKTPEQFVKKLRDVQNRIKKEEEENEEEEGPEELLGKERNLPMYQQEDYATIENSESLKKEMQADIDDLLGMDSPVKQNDSPGQSFPNIRIPYADVLNEQTPGVENQQTGVKIEAAFQRLAQQMFLELKITNKSNQPLNQFLIKLNVNPFRMNPTQPAIQMNQIFPGQQSEGKVEIVCTGSPDNNPPQCPLKIQVALKTNIDVFTFVVPCSLSVLMQPAQALQPQLYTQIQNGEKIVRKQDQLQTNLKAEQLKQKFQNNNFEIVGVRKNPQGVEMVSYSAKTVNEMNILLDTILDESRGALQINIVVPHPSLVNLVIQAIGFIVNLPQYS